LPLPLQPGLYGSINTNNHQNRTTPTPRPSLEDHAVQHHQSIWLPALPVPRDNFGFHASQGTSAGFRLSPTLSSDGYVRDEHAAMAHRSPFAVERPHADRCRFTLICRCFAV